MSKSKILITNGRGIYKYINPSTSIPKNWVVVEADTTKHVDTRDVERDRKSAIIAKLTEEGIPHDGRRSAADLEEIYKDFMKANESEGVVVEEE